MFDDDITIIVEDSIFINLPWPITSKRHMSDMDIDDNNAIWTSATSDPGDDGPYQSAIYKIGNFEISKEKYILIFLILFQRNLYLIIIR